MNWVHGTELVAVGDKSDDCNAVIAFNVFTIYGKSSGIKQVDFIKDGKLQMSQDVQKILNNCE